MTAQTARNRRTADGTMMALGSGWGGPKPTRRGRSWKIGQTHGLGARFPQLSSSIAGMVHASKAELPRLSAAQDRKSTRLNSSHSQISYAVFCLKKKTPGLVKRYLFILVAGNHAFFSLRPPKDKTTPDGSRGLAFIRLLNRTK